MGRRCALHAFRIDHGCAVIGIVVVGAIDDEIVVFGAVAVGADGEESAAGVAADAWAEGNQILEVATVEWEVVDGFVGEGAAESVTGTVDQRSFVGDGDGVGAGASGELQIDTNIFGDFETDGRALNLFKAGSFRGDLVKTGLQVGSDVFAGLVGGESAGNVALGVGDGNFGVGDDGSGLVGYRAENAAIVGLCSSIGAEQEQAREDC